MIQKAKRTSLRTKNPQLNAKIKELKKDFTEGNASGGKIRLYTIDGKNTKIIHVITPYGSQRLLKAVKHKGKIELEQVGTADPGFNHREVYGKMKRKGLGTKMLKSYEARERAAGMSATAKCTKAKSTALFFIKHGYTPIYEARKGSAQKFGIKNTEELIQFVKRENTSEELPFELFFLKKLKKEK